MQAEPDSVGPTNQANHGAYTTEPLIYQCPQDTINCQYDTCIPFVPPVVSGFVVKVYDGDTITIAATSGDGINRRFSVRLAGIDTAEMTSKDPQMKDLAIKAKHHLSERCLRKTVWLSNVTLEKYGRLLATVHVSTVTNAATPTLAPTATTIEGNNHGVMADTNQERNPSICLNTDMVRHRLAVPYTGGTKDVEALTALIKHHYP
jgi:hypothetical protein